MNGEMIDGPGTDKSRTGVFLFFALILLPALVYLNSLPNSFHYDDASYIVGNRYIHNLKYIPHFFVSPRLISDIPLSGFRPLTMTTFALNYAAGGANPFGYHLVNVIIHVLNTLLVFGVALGLARMFMFRIPYQRNMALAVAAVFACHPLNTQSVNYISARSTLLVGGFSLLCMFLYIKMYEAQDEERSRILLFGSLAAYAGALLSKEEAVAVPGILAFFELCRLQPPFDGRRLKEAMLSLVPFIVLTLLFLIYVVYGLRIVEHTPQARGLHENLLTQAKSLFMYLRLIVLPTDLSIDHTLATVTTLFSPVPFATALMVVLILVGSLSLIYVEPAVSFGVWWFFLSLVPTSTLIALKLVVNEQRMYFAGVGLLLLAAAGVGSALRNVENRRAGLRTYAVVGILLLLTCFSVMTIHRNSRWRTPLTLWSDALEQYPDSVRANSIVAGIYVDENRPEQALPLAEKAVRLAPDVMEPRLVLARAYSKLGRQDEALGQARAAVDLNPTSSDARAVLGLVYARLERYEEAKEAWQRAVDLNPENAEARENLQKLRAMLSHEEGQ